MQIRLIQSIDHALLSNYCCGNEEIDGYFKSRAYKDDDAVTYCFLDDSLKTIIALSSLSCNGLVISDHNKIFTNPSIEIKMFAVNDAYQHKCVPDGDGIHWSDYCFDELLSIIYEITDTHCGASRIILYSVPDAVSFYERNSMKRFSGYMRGDDARYLDGCVPMFMHL